jgi:CAAX protease family protein
MKINLFKKLYFGLLVSFIILIVGYKLSSYFENKWLSLLGHLSSIFVAAYFALEFKIKFPKQENKYKMSPNLFIYIFMGVLGLYFVLEWQFKISISVLLKRDYVDVMTYKISLYNVLKYIIIFPIIEELFFRRIISQKIYSAKGFYPALWISSILFSVAHVFSSTNLFGAFVAGIFLGYIYLKTQNIWLSIFAHSLFNTLLLFLSPPISDMILGISDYWVFGTFIAFSFSLIITMTYFINRIKDNSGLKIPTGNNG